MSIPTFKQFLQEWTRDTLELVPLDDERRGVTPKFGQGIQKGDVLSYKGQFWPLVFSAKGIHPKGMKDQQGQDLWLQPSKFKDSGERTKLGKRIFIPA